MSRFAWKWETYEEIEPMTHALLGLKAEIIRAEDGTAQSISIVEPSEDSQVNLTLIFNLESGTLIEAKAVNGAEGLLNDGNEG